LSVVERITFRDGESLIYKSYHNLPTENNFYQRMRTRYIPELYYNHSDGDQHWLLLEDAGKHYPDNLNREQAINLACQARKIICGLGSAEPYRYNLSEPYYNNFIYSLIDQLRKLHQDQKLQKVNQAVIFRIEETLSHPEVLHTVRGPCALLHGDLKLNNILTRPDGEMVIIDWQNVLYGPEEIDIYHLIANLNMDPLPIAGIGPEILRSALALKWLADCIDRWLPCWAGFYDGQIADLEKNLQHITKSN
jgi:thiamine kinase-like enzyme